MSTGLSLHLKAVVTWSEASGQDLHPPALALEELNPFQERALLSWFQGNRDSVARRQTSSGSGGGTCQGKNGPVQSSQLDLFADGLRQIGRPLGPTSRP